MKDAEARVTDATAERQWVAAQIEERNKNPLNIARRPGGYFLSSGGIPQDAEGKTIPESEWAPEDLERIRGRTVPLGVDPAAPVLVNGADVVEGSGSEKRDPRRQRGQRPA